MEVPGGDWVFTGLDRQGAMFAAHSKKRVRHDHEEHEESRHEEGPTKDTKKKTKVAKSGTKKKRQEVIAPSETSTIRLRQT